MMLTCLSLVSAVPTVALAFQGQTVYGVGDCLHAEVRPSKVIFTCADGNSYATDARLRDLRRQGGSSPRHVASQRMRAELRRRTFRQHRDHDHPIRCCSLRREKAMAQMTAVFGELERELHSQRTSDALRELRAQGRAYGPTPYGFRREGDHLIGHPDEQRVLKRIRRLRGKGHSYQRVGHVLNRSGVSAKRGGSWYAASVRSVVQTAVSVGSAQGAS